MFCTPHLILKRALENRRLRLHLPLVLFIIADHRDKNFVMNLRAALLLLISVGFFGSVICKNRVSDFARDEIIEDNEFADFEEFDDVGVATEEPTPSSTPAPSAAEDDAKREAPKVKDDFSDEDEDEVIVEVRF